MNKALSDSVRRHSPNRVTDTHLSRQIIKIDDGRYDPAMLHRQKNSTGLVETEARPHLVVLSLHGPTVSEEPYEYRPALPQWADADHIHVTPTGTSVTRHLNEHSDVIFLHLKSDFVEDVEKSAYGNRCDLSCLPPQLAFRNERMNHLAHILILEEENEEAPEHQVLSNLLVRSLTVHIIRQYRRDCPLSAIKQTTFWEPRIARALAFMTRNFADKITADQLAAISGASRSSFSRLFRETVGQSAYQHLTALRLEHALRLLEQTDISITEIAFESGFGQPTHFTTVFRERFGVSPRAWRNANAAAKSTL